MAGAAIFAPRSLMVGARHRVQLAASELDGNARGWEEGAAAAFIERTEAIARAKLAAKAAFGR